MSHATAATRTDHHCKNGKSHFKTKGKLLAHATNSAAPAFYKRRNGRALSLSSSIFRFTEWSVELTGYSRLQAMTTHLRVQFPSDLHLEFYDHLPPFEELLIPSAPVLALLGDI